MELRIISLLLAVAVYTSGKPISKIPVDPEVEPAREYELMVSKFLLSS